MTEKTPNLMMKYAIYGVIGGLVGVYISHYLGYNDGDMQAYLSGAIVCAVGGGVGGLIRQKQGKTS